MKSPRWALPMATSILLAAGAVEGYQFRTHEKITLSAFEASEGVQTYLQSVGIHHADRFVRFTRTSQRLLANFVNDGTPRDWMIEGVIREDDYSVHPEIEVFLGCPPPENPFSPIDRVLNHFVDVQRGGRGLTLVTNTIGLPAHEWALGKQGLRPLGNEYSLPDARDYQFRSLTATSRSERELNTAFLFRALGHVVHLLQDGAQPQHTRNDPHSGCVPPIGGHHSWFEQYIEMRALERRFRARGIDSPALRLDGYDPPRLASYEAYWKGAQGLAEFSSRNFFSAGTNLALLGGGLCGGLIDPPCSSLAYESPLERRQVFSTRGLPLEGWIQVFYHKMMDPVTGEPLRAAVTSRSFWDQHLEERGHLPVFTLNTINYDSAADLLIPRAVGYSAGLLNRFFRASVGAGGDADQRVIFHNGSLDETLSGTFFILHENPDGVREPLASFALTIPPQGQSEGLNVRKLPPNPPFGTRCWVVFRGTLGEEPNVVAGREMGCPVEIPPRPPGTEWAVYGCLLIPFYPGRPASPDEYVYYTYATQAWIVDQDGNPARGIAPNWRTQCWLSGRGFLPEGQAPLDARFDFLPADFVPTG